MLKEKKKKSAHETPHSVLIFLFCQLPHSVISTTSVPKLYWKFKTWNLLHFPCLLVPSFLIFIARTLEPHHLILNANLPLTLWSTFINFSAHWFSHLQMVITIAPSYEGHCKEKISWAHEYYATESPFYKPSVIYNTLSKYEFNWIIISPYPSANYKFFDEVILNVYIRIHWSLSFSGHIGSQ